VTKSKDWTPVSSPPEMESYRGLWYRLRFQRVDQAVAMDPFAEPVRFELPV
jgi:hypothetical protein